MANDSRERVPEEIFNKIDNAIQSEIRYFEDKRNSYDKIAKDNTHGVYRDEQKAMVASIKSSSYVKAMLRLIKLREQIYVISNFRTTEDKVRGERGKKEESG